MAKRPELVWRLSTATEDGEDFLHCAELERTERVSDAMRLSKRLRRTFVCEWVTPRGTVEELVYDPDEYPRRK